MRVQHLASRSDLERVRREGRVASTPALVAIVSRRPAGPARIGVAAGRKIGQAVQRNRAKRLLRAGIRPLYPSISGGWDVLLMARPPILELKSTHVTQQLDHALRRLRVFAGEAGERM